MDDYRLGFSGEEIDEILAKVKNGELMPSTPSGDPMHYAYEDAGAVWNASTGYWELNGLNDISNTEMCKIYNSAWLYSADLYNGLWNAIFDARTNINKCRYVYSTNLNSVCVNNGIEVFSLADDENFNCVIMSQYASFRYCSKLHTIRGILNLEYCSSFSTSNTFRSCPKLQNIRVKDLKLDISFADSPLLSKESLLYMIDNCASGVSFTITLHPDVYDKCTRNDDTGHEGDWWVKIDEAIGYASEQKNTTITLASA